MTITRSARLLLLLGPLALLGAACGDDDDEDAATTETTEASAETTEAPDDTASDGGSDAATPAGAATVEVTESDLGPILTSGGMTLYVFLPDDGGPSTCNDDCAATWPPLLADGAATPGDGVEGELATAARDDGGEQVTIGGWPLYFFASDAAPGETNGQGVGDVWFVVGPDGEPVQG